MKLDFKNVFDRVDHDFLWATLAAMQLDPWVIALLHGLVTNAEAKVHINGLFTYSFPLEHGVRQGDPMSPLIFALSSQPLMSLLELRCLQGDLTSLQITERESLLF